MTSAVVFAYHDVGVRCLSVLLGHRIEVPLVITHEDDPSESIWFESVERLAALHDVPTVATMDPNAPELVARVNGLRPDFMFSFYYRKMLGGQLLRIPRNGALNLHGSLLPKYRGRAPVNWAIIKGESETGATLHHMTDKPDAGDIVDQMAIPILPDDRGLDVYRKVTCAAEIVLDRTLPALCAGTARRIPQDPSRGSYYPGRKPEDGIIDWRGGAQAIHNLIRAVAPPYPGAFTAVAGRPARILQSLVEPSRSARFETPMIYTEAGRLYADCGDGGVLRVIALELQGKPCSAGDFACAFGSLPQPLGVSL